MSADDLATIRTAFVALDAAETAAETAKLGLDKARKAVEDLGSLMVTVLPVGKPVHITETRYTLHNDGSNVAIEVEQPVLSLEDLAK